MQLTNIYSYKIVGSLQYYKYMCHSPEKGFFSWMMFIQFVPLLVHSFHRVYTSSEICSSIRGVLFWVYMYAYISKLFHCFAIEFQGDIFVVGHFTEELCSSHNMNLQHKQIALTNDCAYLSVLLPALPPPPQKITYKFWLTSPTL